MSSSPVLSSLSLPVRVSLVLGGLTVGYITYRNALPPPDPAKRTKGSTSKTEAKLKADYDGAFYSKWLDGMLVPVHKAMARTARRASDELLVRSNIVAPLELSRRAVDVCCGTGQAAEILLKEGKFSSVVGIDLSPKMIVEAAKRSAKEERLEFQHGDALSVLANYPDSYFDVATICLSLHEMPRMFRVPIVAEMGRVARVVVGVDFPARMGWGLWGMQNRVIEFLSGAEHWSNNRDFRFVSGGLPGIARDAKLCVTSSHKTVGSALEFCVMMSDAKEK